MSLVPGLGIVKGMALTLRRFFEPKATIKYPEVRLDVPHKFRGRLQLLYDEWGTLKCETCFQCAQACPIECIDMGGMDTARPLPRPLGPARDVRRAARGARCGGPAGRCPDPRTEPFEAIDLGAGRRDPRGVRPRPGAHAPDPRGDPGGVRLPAGRRPQADQPPDRRVVRDDLRHRTYYGHLRFEPSRRREQAAGVAATGRPRRPTSPRSTRPRGDGRAARRAGPRRRRWMTPPQDAGRLAEHPARGAPTRDPTDLDAAVRARRLRRPAPGDPRPRADGDDRAIAALRPARPGRRRVPAG